MSSYPHLFKTNFHALGKHRFNRYWDLPCLPEKPGLPKASNAHLSVYSPPFYLPG